MPDREQNVAKATWKGLKTVLSSWTSASVAVDAVKKGDLRLEPAKANCSSHRGQEERYEHPPTGRIVGVPDAVKKRFTSGVAAFWASNRIERCHCAI